MERMELTNPDFLQILRDRKPGTCLMGLDLGTKTIGIAFSDTRLKIASAHKTLLRTKFGKDAEALIAIAETEKVFAIVMGLPINMDGSEGPRAQSTRTFVSNFRKRSALPVVFYDERLSTQKAQEAMIEANISREKRKSKIDAVAAGIILQSALDQIAPLVLPDALP